jgi:hypothetical protein
MKTFASCGTARVTAFLMHCCCASNLAHVDTTEECSWLAINVTPDSASYKRIGVPMRRSTHPARTRAMTWFETTRSSVRRLDEGHWLRFAGHSAHSRCLTLARSRWGRDASHGTKISPRTSRISFRRPTRSNNFGRSPEIESPAPYQLRRTRCRPTHATLAALPSVMPNVLLRQSPQGAELGHLVQSDRRPLAGDARW